jgi:hypothetical protein
MSAWDFDDNDKASFTKFPVGVTRIRVIDAEPHVRWTHWMPQYQKSINCPGRGCPIDEIRKRQKANGEAYSYNMSKRFAINSYNHETSRGEIMEQGVTFFEDLRDMMKELRSDGKKLQDVTLKVKRRGNTKDDTSYRLDIDEESPLSAAELEAVEKKTNLPEYFKPHTPDQILKLITTTCDSPDKYKEAWNAVMTATVEPTHDEGELLQSPGPEPQEEVFEVR